LTQIAEPVQAKNERKCTGCSPQEMRDGRRQSLALPSVE
jgi:hypothetical protein